MKAALQRIVAIALMPVVLALSITAAKRAHGNRGVMLKKIEAVFKDERNAHNNYLVYASEPGWCKLRALFHAVARAEEAISTITLP